MLQYYQRIEITQATRYDDFAIAGPESIPLGDKFNLMLFLISYVVPRIWGNVNPATNLRST